MEFFDKCSKGTFQRYLLFVELVGNSHQLFFSDYDEDDDKRDVDDDDESDDDDERMVVGRRPTFGTFLCSMSLG